MEQQREELAARIEETYEAYVNAPNEVQRRLGEMELEAMGREHIHTIGKHYIRRIPAL